MCIEWYIGRDGGKRERDTISTTHTHKYGKDNNSRTENNMYICTLSGMFEEMVERGKEIQSVQHILINMGKTTTHGLRITCTYVH